GGWGLTTRLAHKLLRNMPIRPHETVTRKMEVLSRHFSECDGYVRTNYVNAEGIRPRRSGGKHGYPSSTCFLF
ncbi:MAG: hypothetical protein IJW79_07005, partial [Clostridia bacterium]|nr:hypothetical protein [Clostridia bacterium]